MKNGATKSALNRSQEVELLMLIYFKKFIIVFYNETNNHDWNLLIYNNK